MSDHSRRSIARLLVALVVLGSFTPAALAAVTDTETGTPGTVGLEAGTIERTPDASTIVAIQGFHFRGQGSTKKPARLVSVSPNGTTQWVIDGSTSGARWFYDVDPLPNGNLLVVSTNADGTLVFELNPDTRERVWEEEFDFHDTHDVDKLPNGNLLIANMRNYDSDRGVSNDRVLVYNRTTNEIVWEYLFRNHFPNSTDGGFNDDWTHVNDVDRVSENEYLVSPRNFDQAIVINRSKEIVHRLGSDGDHDTLFEQHNPDYLESESGNPTILVADSENDRVVEYAKRNGEWVQTWELGTGQLAWPRDADRLPNGNTLIVDSLNHRVIEVTPRGKIVWEYYATWGPYDAERMGTGDGSSGPTMADQGVTGNYTLTNSAGLIEGTGNTDTFAATVQNTFAGTALGPTAAEFATRWAHVTPWIRPVWMNSWAFAWLTFGVLLTVGWGLAELIAARHRIAGVVRGSVAGR